MKQCAICGIDVTALKRFRDAQGNYYCEPCYTSSQGAPASAAGDSGGVNEMPDHAAARALGLLPVVTCPHCWHQFPPSQILWVAQHSDLIGDPVLGPEKPRRFLPTRFTPEGQAIDSRNSICQNLACPRCRLIIPPSVIELEPLFISVIGGPRSGKSYFLASMTWELRRQMPSEFALTFSDADTVSNQVLTEYEATLFLSPDPDKLVAIRKTELEGELYDQVNLGGQVMSLPRPFLFNVRPGARHPHANKRSLHSRLVCLYDNAGEHFQPGMDRPGSPVTQHLARSKVLMFLFDPTQDPRFRERCRALSADPQLGANRNTQRQETLLIEASLRVRRFSNLSPSAKHQRPLIVVVSKSDVWGQLLAPDDLVSEPIVHGTAGRLSAMDILRVERISARLRAMLLQFIPELVSAAEDFCEHVVYIPVSALGGSPVEKAIGESGDKGLFVRPSALKPRWAAVPVTFMFAKWATGLIGTPVPARALGAPPAAARSAIFES
jgi:hypothetical protein